MGTLQSSGYAPINGLQMYYEVHGKGGMPLVLIHGGGSTIETSFGIILPLLAKNNQVIAVELQCHGRTSNRPSASSFEQDADDVVALLNHLQIKKANIAGFSNGGNAAMQVAIRRPDIVNRLVIISSFYKRDGIIPGLFEGLNQGTIDDMPGPLKEAFLAVAPDKTLLQTMFENDRQRMLHFKDWPDEALQSIQAHTLFMVADQDVITPEHTVAMYRLLPNARLMMLPGTHGSFIGEVCTAQKNSKQPAFVAETIQEFLNE